MHPSLFAFHSRCHLLDKFSITESNLCGLVRVGALETGSCTCNRCGPCKRIARISVTPSHQRGLSASSPVGEALDKVDASVDRGSRSIQNLYIRCRSSNFVGRSVFSRSAPGSDRSGLARRPATQTPRLRCSRMQLSSSNLHLGTVGRCIGVPDILIT